MIAPCKKCGGTERKHGHCPRCFREYFAKWYETNKERVYQNTVAWRASNPDRFRATSAAYYAANIDKERARHIRRRESGEWRTDATREQNRRRAARPENKEKKRQAAARRYAANPAKDLERQARRKALMQNQSVGAITADDIKAIFEETHYTCVYCGGRATTLDHVTPLARGGAHAIHNLAPACGPCNFSKGDRLVAEWKGRASRSGTK